jgi:hypothetical protein
MRGLNNRFMFCIGIEVKLPNTGFLTSSLVVVKKLRTQFWRGVGFLRTGRDARSCCFAWIKLCSGSWIVLSSSDDSSPEMSNSFSGFPPSKTPLESVGIGSVSNTTKDYQQVLKLGVLRTDHAPMLIHSKVPLKTDARSSHPQRLL